MYPLQLSSLCSSSSQIHNNQDFLVETKTSHNPKKVHHLSSSNGLFSDEISSLRLCAAKRNLKLGSCIHAKIVKLGLDSDGLVSNSLAGMYAKCEQIDYAAKVFHDMPHRTVVSWTSVMSGYCKKGLIDEVVLLFQQMLDIFLPNEYTLSVLLRACAQKGDSKLVEIIHGFAIKYGFDRDDFFQNSLIDAYVKSGMLVTAEEILHRLKNRDVVSWTTVLSGHVGSGMIERALVLFFEMQKDGVQPNIVTILSILMACSLIGEYCIFQWIHGLIMKTELCRNARVMNSIVQMYANNGYFREAVQIFRYFCFTGEGLYLNPKTMATLLQGFDNSSSSFMLGEEIHGYLIKHRFVPSNIIENSLVNMYGKSGQLDLAFQLFRMMNFKDITSWNTIMTCLVKNERSSEVLNLLTEIHTYGERDNIFPDFITLLASIKACSNLSSLQLGQVIHGYSMRTGLISDIFVQNCFIDMYGKSGRLDLAKQMFEEMPVSDLGSWNSLIAARGMNGNGITALQTFTKLKKSGIYKPDEITFTSVLSACAHSGLIEEGLEIFDCMKTEYGISPRMEHFASMVDILGRSGRLEEAEAFIEKMPLTPGPDVWGTLLGACAHFNNVEIGERAARKLSVLEPNSSLWRVTVSNVYASVGRWEEVAKTRAEVGKSEELKKCEGWSSVEVKGEMYRFRVADTSYPESETIYDVLNGMREHIVEAVTEKVTSQ